jgi:hypothetical protein
MKNAIKRILDGCLSAGLLLAVTSAGCEEEEADVAYEDGYAGDYVYPADIGYAGGFVGGGYYAAAVGTSAITARGAVGQAIRTAVQGGDVCGDKVTVTPRNGASVCGDAGTGVTVVFNDCELSNGGMVDGTVDVQLNRSASNVVCDGSTDISLGYTATITDLTYTGVDGRAIFIPNQKSTATINHPFGQMPATVEIETLGEVQRFELGGAKISDRMYSGTQTLSSISLANQSYTLSGVLNVTDESGATGTLTGTDLTIDTSCCRPTGGTLAISRTGGNHAGSHTWTYTPTCGSATLDNTTVTLPDCL